MKTQEQTAFADLFDENLTCAFFELIEDWAFIVDKLQQIIFSNDRIPKNFQNSHGGLITVDLYDLFVTYGVQNNFMVMKQMLRGELESFEMTLCVEMREIPFVVKGKKVKAKNGDEYSLFLFHDLSNNHYLKKYVRTTRRNTLAMMQRIIELQDKSTLYHQRRVANVCRTLVPVLSLPTSVAKQLVLAALFHDVGKVGTKAIYNKPGKLDRDEWAIMKGHPETGAQLLEKICETEPLVVEMVVMHHEKLDGNGYPRGLMKAQIPFYSRIIPVVDIFDAMTDTRPYHPPFPPSEAIAYLQEQSGVTLDHRIVEAVIALHHGQPDVFKTPLKLF